MLEVVTAGVPEGSQIVLSSRHEPANLARRRVAGDLVEIGIDDLRVDVAGARRIFDAAESVADDDELGEIVRRCEGWPTGVFLAAMISRRGPGGFAITGEDRFIADYLYEECLAGLPERTRTFLRCTAVLDRLSAPACDALLDATDSGDRLREVEAAGLFLIPLDGSRGLFRYHALFREFLLSELVRDDPRQADALHRRAADWDELHGAPDRAIDHLLASGERERSVHLITRLALPTYQEGRVAVVGRWMADIGDAAIIAHPPLAVLRAWTALLTGDAVAAERWANIVDGLEFDGDQADDQPTFASGRAMLRAAMCREGARAALADAEFAVASEPTWSPWRDQALHLCGSARLLAGEVDGARAAFAEASAQALTMGNTDTVVLAEAELAAMDADANRWADAEAHARTALRAIEAHHMEGYPTTALALACAARVEVHRGDVASARRTLARGMRARVQCTHTMPYLAIKVRLQLARAHLPLGDRATAMHLVHEMQELLAKRPDLGRLPDEVEAFREQVSRVPSVNGNAPLTPAELRLLPYLQTHLTIREIADRLYISRNTAGSEVTSIYRKLDVTARSEAVVRAVELGLLGG
ncbi:LuxR C-terminal-related transcriptional regulator [Agromyces marinus]|uniref:LuxR C-terminal-related transcriptional regulator n=1 Tax=Agromyces marinus TaxID=1389020 RepID=UPI0025744475|nr:LuxR C-terminal-related transcriptional regulator [Agromyces marinus]